MSDDKSSGSNAESTSEENYISIDDFAKVELRTAKITEAEHHPDADRLLKLTLDVGGKSRTICAGIRQWYEPEDLIGKTVVIVANLKPRKMRGIESQGMILAVQEGEDGDVVPLTGMKDVSSGLRVS